MTKLCLLLATLVSVSHADFVVTLPQPIYKGYIDPIVSNGVASAHSHDIFGPSSITQYTKNADELKRSVCTGADFVHDKSAYWYPSVLMKDGTGNDEKIIRLLTSTKIYYRTGAETNATRWKDLNYEPLINGLQFLSRPKANTLSSSSLYQVSYHCAKVMKNGKPSEEGVGELKPKLAAAQDCVEFVSQIALPTCWNGEMTGEKFLAHMAYATNNTCPGTHPREIPEILMELHVMFPKPVSWSEDPAKLPFFFSNDPEQTMDANVAYGLHADFFGAWDKTNLMLIVEECAAKKTSEFCGLPSGATSQKLKDARIYNMFTAQTCVSEKNPFGDGDIKFAPHNITFDLLHQKVPVDEPAFCFATDRVGNELCWGVDKASKKLFSRRKIISNTKLSWDLWQMASTLKLGNAYSINQLAYNSTVTPWVEQGVGSVDPIFALMTLTKVDGNKDGNLWAETPFKQPFLDSIYEESVVLESSNDSSLARREFANKTTQYWQIVTEQSFSLIQASGTTNCLELAGEKVGLKKCDKTKTAQQWNMEATQLIVNNTEFGSVNPTVYRGAKFRKVFRFRSVQTKEVCLSVNNQKDVGECNSSNAFLLKHVGAAVQRTNSDQTQTQTGTVVSTASTVPTGTVASTVTAAKSTTTVSNVPAVPTVPAKTTTTAINVAGTTTAAAVPTSIPVPPTDFETACKNTIARIKIDAHIIVDNAVFQLHIEACIKQARITLDIFASCEQSYKACKEDVKRVVDEKVKSEDPEERKNAETVRSKCMLSRDTCSAENTCKNGGTCGDQGCICPAGYGTSSDCSEQTTKTRLFENVAREIEKLLMSSASEVSFSVALLLGAVFFF